MTEPRQCVECGRTDGWPGDPDPQVHVYGDWCGLCGWYHGRDGICPHADPDDTEPGLFPEPPHPDTTTEPPF